MAADGRGEIVTHTETVSTRAVATEMWLGSKKFKLLQ